ncbi:hypothetical protein [Brevibacillus fulvus]|uniref:Uncharacterized protein n=1 Tax=Brevibacillus fulvus TaxID=1125967 RepID=A0A938Y357_9BACL|nr:hypothetical protein [Brevibacillus fulvus]MBM7592318.1 hypothetical protein [Brevibacillus fulvus]
MDLREFLLWEQATRDCIDVKKIYVDMADDLIAGILLSQIVYWFLPDKEGRTKLRVKKDGVLWLAKSREDWWDECRIKPRQFDTAFKKLEEQGLVEKKTFKFNGDPTIHIRILWDKFLPRLQDLLYQLENTVSESADQEETAETLDTTGFYESVKTGFQPETLDTTGFYESVKTGSQFGEIVMLKSVKTITENSNKELLKEREREEAANAALNSSPDQYDELLERNYELLKEMTKRVFGMPRAEQVDVESIWNHWHNRFPQYDLTHLYAVMRATQQTARIRDDLTGIIVKRLPNAKTALIPVKQQAIEYVARLQREIKRA